MTIERPKEAGPSIDAAEIDAQCLESVPDANHLSSYEPVRRVNWKAIELLLFVALLLGFGSYQFVTTEVAEADDPSAPSIDPAGIRITKYASPADGTDFLFTCEDQDTAGGPGCPSSSITLEDVNSATVEMAQYTEIISPVFNSVFTFTEQVTPGWLLYDIQCQNMANYGNISITDTSVVIEYDNYDFWNYTDTNAGFYCNFYNAKPSTITVRKDTQPPQTTPFSFDGDLGSFALVDDQSGFSDTVQFAGLTPGKYSVYELDETFDSVQCVNRDQAVVYGEALYSPTIPIVSGYAYSYSASVQFTNTGYAQIYRSDSTESRGVLEYPLPDDLSLLDRAELELEIQRDDNGCLPADVTISASPADGLLLLSDFFSGAYVEDVNLVADQTKAIVDVTDVISSYIANTEPNIGLNLRYKDENSCNLYIVGSSRLNLYTKRGVEIPLEGDQEVTCTFTNVLPKARINVKKVVLGNTPVSSWSFTQTVVGGSPSQQTFTLPAIGGTNVGSVFDLSTDSGRATITETVKPGYYVESTCDNGANGTNVVSFDIFQGNDVTCTFTNSQAGGIIIDKVVLPSTDQQEFDFSWGPAGGPTSGSFTLKGSDAPAQTGQIPPGIYTVEEDPVTGWDLVSATCNDGTDTYPSDNIVVKPGATVFCTFENARMGRIIVDKQTDPSGDQTSFNFTWGPDSAPKANNFALRDDQTPFNSGLIPAGDYVVEESALAGWSLTDANCSDQFMDYDPSAITVTPGETITCVFQNERVDGSNGVYLPKVAR